MTSERPAKKPLILGLTGSIGMGKSTVAAMFRDAGIPVFDADAEVHRLQGPGGALVGAIAAAFPGTTGAAGVDRGKLGAAVLGDKAALARLEAIVHPAVAAARADFVRAHADAPMLVFDIPLLFEKGGADAVDVILVVSCGEAEQAHRVLARPGMHAEKFAAIRAHQMPDAEKRARADHVIDTAVSPAATRAQILALIACLSARAGA
ncbi:MAG: dephospho-CoA kinase [Sphingomonadaceae bacterium]|nr:dephospho-CoA kinase [Sphingomonadaceae bacterium]